MPLPDLAIHPEQLPRQMTQGGIRVREDTLYSDQRGKEKKAIRKRATKALEKLQEPLSKLLEPDEVVLYVARAQAPASWFEQFTFGWVIYYLTGTMLVFTNRRLLHFLIKSNGTWKRSLRSVRWGDVAEAKIGGFLLRRTLELRYRNGKKDLYWGLRGDDGKKIKVLLAVLLPVAAGEASAAQEMIPLCPNCHAALTAGVYRCGQCFLDFKDETTMVRRSLFFPGGGYFYTGNRFLGVLDFVVEGYLSLLVLVLLLYWLGLYSGMPPDPGEERLERASALISACLFGVFLAIEKYMTIHHCRRFVREFIPAK